MHDVHVVFADHLDQPRNVAPHGQNVLGMNRQLDVRRSAAQHLAHHRAAVRGDDRPPAGIVDRRGHVDRAAFDPAGFQRRQNLQHRRRLAPSAPSERTFQTGLRTSCLGETWRLSRKTLSCQGGSPFKPARSARRDARYRHTASTGGGKIAYRHRPGKSPGVMFCPGYHSTMEGDKATALDAVCARAGGLYAFRLSGTRRILRRVQGRHHRPVARRRAGHPGPGRAGPAGLVGSSMGAWIALLLAAARRIGCAPCC